MKQFIILIGFVVGLVFFFASCGKSGCTDVNSTNYCEKCNQSDGSCTYKAPIVFWWKKAFADSCTAHGIVKFGITLDCISLGNISFSGQSWTSVPACGASSTLTVSKDLGVNKTVTVPVHYDVIFSNGSTSSLGDVSHGTSGDQSRQLIGGTCNNLELTW